MWTSGKMKIYPYFILSISVSCIQQNVDKGNVFRLVHAYFIHILLSTVWTLDTYTLVHILYICEYLVTGCLKKIMLWLIEPLCGTSFSQTTIYRFEAMGVRRRCARRKCRPKIVRPKKMPGEEGAAWAIKGRIMCHSSKSLCTIIIQFFRLFPLWGFLFFSKFTKFNQQNFWKIESA